MTDHTSTHKVREIVGGAAHLCDSDTPICGTPASRKLVTVRPVNPETYVTCSKCRRLAGWATVAGSLASRKSIGLDSSAWGANRGR